MKTTSLMLALFLLTQPAIHGADICEREVFETSFETTNHEKDHTRINPGYFDYADRRIKHLINNGIVPALVGGWGWHMPSMGVEKMNRHWRYLIARYGAFPVVWIVAGEMQEARWAEVARYVRKTDPYPHLATMHPPGVPALQSGRKTLNDDTLLDFDLLQTAHNDWTTAPITVSQVTSSYSKTPTINVAPGKAGLWFFQIGDQQEFSQFELSRGSIRPG